jgi:hypothetical protein
VRGQAAEDKSIREFGPQETFGLKPGSDLSELERKHFWSFIAAGINYTGAFLA